MRIYRLFTLMIILTTLVNPTYADQVGAEGWEVVAEGIEYQRFYLPDPNNVFVTRMDRSNINTTIESSIPHGGLSGSLETVRSMADRAEQAINYWGGSFTPATWGARNDVVVAINGSYFDFNTGQIYGGMIHSGWYSKRYEDCSGFTGFGWTLNRIPFIGENIRHRPEKNIVSFPATNGLMEINKVNAPRKDGDFILYTPQYAETTLTNDTGVEVVVEMTRPTMLLPEPNVYAKGIVRSIRQNNGDTTIPFDHVVLSASGILTIETLLDNATLGSEVRISQELTSLEDGDCNNALEEVNWTKTFASIQGHYYFLKNGIIDPYDDDPNATDLEPRTAIAFNDEYIFFIVVDGRDVYHSIGMTIEALARFVRDTLGADYAVAQDGGGSSTLVVNGDVKNNVYCNNVFCMDSDQYFNYLPLAARKVTQELINAQALNNINAYTDTYERWVANGMMMVVVEPPVFTSTFTITQEVILNQVTNVYTGPGTNFHVQAELPAGSQGVIVDSLSALNGVWARDTYWWKVDFGVVTGWIQHNLLSPEK